MQLELLCISYTSNLATLKQGKIPFGIGQKQHCAPIRTVCKDTMKADTLTTELKIKNKIHLKYILNGLILWYVNYISKRLLFFF